jgi:predicted enzyme related to lactoylglutathione lyase
VPEHTSPLGAPCWIDLISSDMRRATDFYTELFGWTRDPGDDPELGDFTMFRKDGKPIAGLSPSMQGNPYANIWSVYMATTDAADTVAKAAVAGGTVMLPPMPVQSEGTVAMFADPAGAVVGAWQAAEHPGFGLVDEPGAPVWFESFSRDYNAALRFYTEVFGWTYTLLSDTDEFRYAQGRSGEHLVAGIMDADRALPDGVPSFWQFYFGVEDTDDACERIIALGGQVVRPPQDSPFGRLAGVADPMGATFQITTLVEQ